MVPKDALVSRGPRVAVFVVKDGVATEVGVQRGVEVEDRVEVTGGVMAGQSVVVRGNERLRSGMPVAVASP